MESNPLSWFPSEPEIANWAKGERRPKSSRVKEIHHNARALAESISQGPDVEIPGLKKEVCFNENHSGKARIDGLLKGARLDYEPNLPKPTSKLIILEDERTGDRVRIHLPLESGSIHHAQYGQGYQRLNLCKNNSPVNMEIGKESVVARMSPSSHYPSKEYAV